MYLNPEWKPKRCNLTSKFTTDWNELVKKNIFKLKLSYFNDYYDRSILIVIVLRKSQNKVLKSNFYLKAIL